MEGTSEVYLREQHGALSGHLLSAEQVVAARTVDAPMSRAAPMVKVLEVIILRSGTVR